MRVLWIFEHLSAQAREVAYNLAERSDVTLEVMTPWNNDPPLDPALVPLTRLHCRHKVDFSARRVIRQKLKSASFDLAHAYTSRDLANLIGARHGVRPLPKLIGYRGTVNRLQWLDPAHWITFWHPAVTKIHCVCHATQRTLEASRISASKLTTVWEGCDASVLQTPSRHALADFDIPPDAFVVGTVANMRPVKGVDLLLRAAVELADLPNVYWLLIGTVQDPRIQRLAEDPRIAARVRLPGRIAKGGRFAGLFDVYVAPSRMEGLSMGIMEAMASRTCPVVTKVGGSPELVRHEVDGLVVPPEDPGAIARAIRKLYQAPDVRQRFAESAAQRVQDEFSTAKWADRMYQAYRQTLGESQQPAAISRAA
jgi:glycosyltransferase involved in cell wall biosynthesis